MGYITEIISFFRGSSSDPKIDAAAKSSTTEDRPPQGFPLERMLQESAAAYCRRVEKPLTDYLMHGISVDAGRNPEERLGYFVKLIPKDTEVVVECKTIEYNEKLALRGYALIPLEKIPDEERIQPPPKTGRSKT